ncbi:hypothetical protein [Vibrio phage vB_VmeM-Yong XC32]|nr:hypothetical protein [Vibrio phage vB_VmeM-Yong XC31]QAX96617.1 hypothetical protein [Vibrio phage vB_VmeM-Yong XC32]QAX96935.1 hypothetical protein [Vibrio phage vB_VmeM-Yong MS31]QAX97240.1 hypothetical protein [Vibrio phage vB_VmeM-Yong MS32]
MKNLSTILKEQNLEIEFRTEIYISTEAKVERPLYYAELRSADNRRHIRIKTDPRLPERRKSGIGSSPKEALDDLIEFLNVNVLDNEYVPQPISVPNGTEEGRPVNLAKAILLDITL